MKEYFDCENEIIGFDTEEEFFDKIRYLDNNPSKASEISNNAFKKKIDLPCNYFIYFFRNS